MQDAERKQRCIDGDERAMLTAFLDFQRDTLIWKLSSLTEEQIRKPWTPSGTSLLGLVKHLGYVERSWFQRRFQGLEVHVAWHAGPPDSDFRIEPDETPKAILDFYLGEVEQSRRITAEAPSLDAMAQRQDRVVSLRWILIHMIEETARHVGHADILRELTDGRTGE
jgi:hypothetical protein